MALTTMIPEIWSARFLDYLDKNFVYANVANRFYQPDAEYGNLIHVDQVGPIAIGDYTKDTNITAPEVLDNVQTDVAIDQQSFFHFQIDSIDEAQTQPRIMDAAMGRAAYAMANVVDTYLASFYATATTAIGGVGTEITPDADTIYGYLTQAAQVLDEQNVPTNDRYIVMSPAGIKLLRDAGEFLVATAMGDVVRTTGGMGGMAPMPNGYVGQAGGFAVWSSNNTPAATTSTSIWQAGHSMGITMVDSVNRVVGYESELRFNEAVKGLYVYGGAMINPGAVVPLYTDL